MRAFRDFFQNINSDVLIIVGAMMTLLLLYQFCLINTEVFVGFLTSIVTVAGFYIAFKQNSRLEKYKFLKTQEIKILVEISEIYQPLKLFDLYNETAIKLSGREGQVIHQFAREGVRHKIVTIQIKVRAFLKIERANNLHHLLGEYEKKVSSCLDFYSSERVTMYNLNSEGKVVSLNPVSDKFQDKWNECEKEYEKIITEINRLVNENI